MMRTIWMAAVMGTLAGAAQAQDEFRSFAPTTGTILQEGGEAVYDSVCAGCHMPDGEGAVGAGVYPALENNELLEFPAYPIYVVVAGQGAMPPLGGILTDQQVADVVNYIRGAFGNDYAGGEAGDATPEDVAGARP